MNSISERVNIYKTTSDTGMTRFKRNQKKLNKCDRCLAITKRQVECLRKSFMTNQHQ